MNPHNDNEMVDTLPTDPLVRQPHPVNQVTTLSKYLALGLFIVLPFFGAFVGYNYAPVQNVTTMVYTPLPTTATISDKTSREVLMTPFIDTAQIDFFERRETEGSTNITFTPNSDFEKANGEVVFTGMLEFAASDYSGTWVGMFTPGEETLRMLPAGEPESLPEYFYIVDPDTVTVLCASFDCVNYAAGEAYTAEISFTPDRLTYETYNRGFGSYPKTMTFEEVEIISPTN